MTTPDPARAAVEAWMAEQCPHDPLTVEKHYCPDCLLAFAAAQRAEEREACAKIVDAHYSPGPDWICYASVDIRARREGPRGEQ